MPAIRVAVPLVHQHRWLEIQRGAQHRIKQSRRRLPRILHMQHRRPSQHIPTPQIQRRLIEKPFEQSRRLIHRKRQIRQLRWNGVHWRQLCCKVGYRDSHWGTVGRPSDAMVCPAFWADGRTRRRRAGARNCHMRGRLSCILSLNRGRGRRRCGRGERGPGAAGAGYGSVHGRVLHCRGGPWWCGGIGDQGVALALFK
jgi:hypothetical protein